MPGGRGAASVPSPGLWWPGYPALAPPRRWLWAGREGGPHEGQPPVKKTFALNTEPHVAEIPGVADLEFIPEAMGDEFLDAYQEMRQTQRERTGVDVDKVRDGADVDGLRKVTGALRIFLSRLMLPASAELITRVDVVRAGAVLETFQTWEAAAEYAETAGDGARPVWGLRLPDRILVQLLDWTVELYAGGGKRPPTSSGGSSARSSTGGKRSTGASRSRG